MLLLANYSLSDHISSTSSARNVQSFCCLHDVSTRSLVQGICIYGFETFLEYFDLHFLFFFQILAHSNQHTSTKILIIIQTSQRKLKKNPSIYQPSTFQIPFFNEESFSAELGYTNYTWDQVLNSTIAFPRTFNKQRNELHHDQCHYFERDYVHIKLSPWAQVKDMNATGKINRCKEWEYDTSVIENQENL